MFPIRDHNPSGRTPFVTLALIAINVVVFLGYFTTMNDWALSRFFTTWGGGWMHIIGNMLFLWIFGDNLEDEMGHLPFLLFYLASGLAAAALQFAAEPGSPIPMVGASGAIAGVMGGYLLMFPKARVDVLVIIVIFFRVFALRAWIVLGLWSWPTGRMPGASAPG